MFLAQGCGSSRWPLSVNGQCKRLQDRDESLHNFSALRHPSPYLGPQTGFLCAWQPPFVFGLEGCGGEQWARNSEETGELGSLVWPAVPTLHPFFPECVVGLPHQGLRADRGLEGGEVGGSICVWVEITRYKATFFWGLLKMLVSGQ